MTKKLTVYLLIVLTAAISVACNGIHTHKRSAVDTTVVDKPDTLTVALVGDMMFGTTYPKPVLPPHDGNEIFTDCGSLLLSADVACGNLEGVFADEGKPRKTPGAKGSFSFLMPTRLVQCLKNVGFDFVGIANNHIFDFYQEGVESTMATLKEAGIQFAGNEKCPYAINEFNGFKVGFCAFGHSIGTLHHTDTANVHAIIAELHKKVDIVIVCFHGGCEGSAARHLPDDIEWAWGENRGHLRDFTHQCIDWGADLVFGHGPHVVRAMEVYKGHFIAYSLGNFATPSGMGVAGPTGYAPLVIVRMSRDGKMVDGRIHGFIQKANQGPRHDTRGIVVDEIQLLTSQDFLDGTLKIDDQGYMNP